MRFLSFIFVNTLFFIRKCGEVRWAAVFLGGGVICFGKMLGF